MAEDKKEDGPEVRVARLFQLAGHEVTQAVGEEPGTVDWFATPREGFVRPRTYWQAWRTCPQRLDEMLEALERARVAKHADRALGVVTEGRLPEGYRADIAGDTTNAVTYRVLTLALAGIIEQVREHVEQYERGGRRDLYLPRRARSEQALHTDAASLIEDWATSDERHHLAVPGDRWRTTMRARATTSAGSRRRSTPSSGRRRPATAWPGPRASAPRWCSSTSRSPRSPAARMRTSDTGWGRSTSCSGPRRSARWWWPPRTAATGS